MPKKHPPKSVTSNGRVTEFAFLPKLASGQTIEIHYSTDVANDDFLQVQRIVVNTVSGGVPSLPSFHEPGSNTFEAYRKDPEFQDALITHIGKTKNDIINQGTNALLDAVEAAGKSGNAILFRDAPVNTSSNPTQPPISGIGTNITSPTVKTPTANPVVFPSQIGVGVTDNQEFIQSINNKDTKYISLKYPFDAAYGNGQDHLVIEQFTYRPPQESQLRTQEDLFRKSGGSNKSKKSKSEVTPLIDFIKRGVRRNSNLRDFLGVVKLPIPNNLSLSNGVDWGDKKANPVEMGAFFSAMNIAGPIVGGNLGEAARMFGKGIGDLFGAVGAKTFSPDNPGGLALSAFISQYALGKLGINVDPAQFIARGTGNTVNPNLELLFSGPKLRSFAFKFILAPNEEKEASECRRILRFFKQGMAAKRGSANTLFLGSPNVFRLRYLTKENEIIRGLPRYKICALTSCDIDYAPGQTYQSYDDSKAGSQPVMMSLTLNFTELTPLFSTDYLQSGLEFSDNQDLFSRAGGMGTLDPITSEDVGF
tara:strand:+ start:1572 stop:3176 length:1605 start_codon:yes stop_codon:yes gene_type:complete